MDSGGRALDAYDRWIGMLDDGAPRARNWSRCGARPRTHRTRTRVWRSGREGGLLVLLFETPLVVLVRDYGVF